MFRFCDSNYSQPESYPKSGFVHPAPQYFRPKVKASHVVAQCCLALSCSTGRPMTICETTPIFSRPQHLSDEIGMLHGNHQLAGCHIISTHLMPLTRCRHRTLNAIGPNMGSRLCVGFATWRRSTLRKPCFATSMCLVPDQHGRSVLKVSLWQLYE